MLFKKKDKTVPWRNEKGEITCDGSSCVGGCDESCPIYLNTEVAMMLNSGNQEKAFLILKKMIEIAPDFYDAWNNIAVVYGLRGEPQKAIECYQKAHSIKPERPAPVKGLAIAFNAMADKEKALEWCDYYENTYHESIDDIRNAINGVEVDEELTAMDFVPMALTLAINFGMITSSKNLPSVPELMLQGKSVCSKIEEEFGKSDMCADLDEETYYDYLLMWSALAGMGSVMLWHKDWDRIKEEGLISALIDNARGIDYMDEEVYDLIGMEFQSNEQNDFAQKLHLVSSMVKGGLFGRFDDKEDAIDYIGCTQEAMFFLGMFIEMNRLGFQ